MNDVFTAKNELRKKYLAKRKELDEKYRSDAERRALQNLVSTKEFSLADKIFLYYPIKCEADPLPLLEIAQKRGKKVAFPKCNKEDFSMKFFEISSRGDFLLGAYNIPEPKDELCVLEPDKKTLCVVPALLYSKDGHRLGYGKGFYDRFLANFDGVSVGFTYDVFVADELPHDAFDLKLDMIITEKGVYFSEK